MKRRAFFYHYNRPETLRRGRTIISVHWGGACWLVNAIRVAVPTRSRISKKSPRFVMVGRAHDVDFHFEGRDYVAVIS